MKFQVVLRGSQGHFKEVRRCVREVSIEFQGQFKEVLKKFEGYFKKVSRKIKGCFKGLNIIFVIF